MTALRIAGAATLAAALLTGCSSLKVTTDYDRDVDFDRYQTYRWAPSKKTAKTVDGAAQSLMDRRIRRAVDYEMAALGFAVSKDRAADLLVVYRATSKDRVDVYQHYNYRGTTSVYRYKEGTLTIMFVDPEMEEQVVWQGWASDVVSNPDRAEESIQRAVRAILSRFPPH